MDLGRVGQWIAIGTAVVAGLYRFYALEEAKDTAIRNHAAQAEEIGALKSQIEKLKDERIDAARLDERMRSVAEDVKELKSDVKAIDEKVSKRR